MTMNIFAPSNTVRVGDVIQLPFYCSEPGDVVFTSSDETVAVVESGITVAGTRVWRNGLKHGQYLARANCLQSRDTFALFAEIDTRSIPRTNTYTNNTYANIDVIGSVRADASRRWNWCLQVLQSSGLNASLPWYVWHYLQSNTSSVSESLLSSLQHYYTLNTTIRLIVTCEGTAVNFYWTTGTSADSAHPTGRTAPTGTMGGSEFFFIAVPGKFAKLEGSLPSQAQREAFISSGTLPPGLAASYQGGHEIVESAPVFWDTAGTNDLTKTNVQYWPPAAASGDYTDDPGDPVVPYTSFQVVAQSVGTSTITARRRRNGVPYRTPPLSDAEVYEETTYNLTVEAPLASEQSVLQLMIYADRDGTATISMDNPIIDFPASVAVVEGKNQVSGIATGSGTCNVTVEMNGSSSVTTFNIEEIVTIVSSGPPQNLRSRI
jgi:hypothetical protein